MKRRATPIHPIAPALLAAGLLAGLLVTPPAVDARSLWEDGHDLTRDFRAAQVGDQLTILIVESSSGSNQARTRTEKSTDAELEAGPGLGALDFIPLVGLNGEYSSSHDGRGLTTRSNSVEAKITATVTAVRPNGDLEVTGTRTIIVNNETQKIMLTGVVRPRDISASNTVLSTFVGEAEVVYAGAGIVTRGQRVGWWKWLLDWLF
jgi:flagellar L-ring protein precursor FlgH